METRFPTVRFFQKGDAQKTHKFYVHKKWQKKTEGWGFLVQGRNLPMYYPFIFRLFDMYNLPEDLLDIYKICH